MKKYLNVVAALFLGLWSLGLVPARALTIAPMAWTAGRSDWINVMTDAQMTVHAAGDGTTDDTAALQQALNLASASHSNRTTVYLPAGTYKITSTLYWNNNVSSIQSWGGAYGLWLVGCGSNTTIQWAGAAGPPMLLDQGSSRSHYEGIVWNAGPSTAAAGFGVAHVSIAYYQTRMRHENEAFIGFVGANGQGTISPPYAYTHTTGTVSTASTLPAGMTSLPLSSIPAGLIVGAGITGTGIPTGAGGVTTTTVAGINTSTNTITLSVATNHSITNGTTYNFTSSVAGTPETIPAAGIMSGSARETSPTAEFMIWNCLFQNDTNGVIVGYEVYNNYMWIFKSCEFDNCGTAIFGGDGKLVVMDTHFSDSTTVDILPGVITRARRCTSTGSKLFFQGGATGSPATHVLEDCWVDGWTNTNGAVTFNDRTDMVFDTTFTNPPSGATGDIFMWPPNPLDVTLSNNSTTSATVPISYVRGGTVNIVNIPPGNLGPNITSATQTFLQSTWPADGPTILDITQAPYNAVRGTDCTAAIQSAITQAAANNNGTIVYIPAGSYKISSTLNVSGGNYSIQGSGWISQLTWSGSIPSTTPFFTVTTPQNINISQMQVAVAALTGGVSTQPCISETSTGPSYAVYDEVSSGGYTSSPGIVLTSLPIGSTVLMPLCDSALTVNDCGPAVIFSNYLCLNGALITGATQPKTGFLGVLAMEGGQGVSTSAWDVTINDNQDFIGCDYYNEQSYNHLLAENTDGATWTGRVSFQGMKEESDAPSTTIGIQNYAGRVFYGSQGFIDNSSPAQFIQSGTAAVDLVLLQDVYYDNPTFNLGSSCNLIAANNLYTNPSVTYLPNTEPTGWGASAAAALDHFRQADGYDLLLNYNVPQAPSISNGLPATAVTVNTAFSFSFATTGYPAPIFSVTAGSLPPGLTLSSAGVLSGTPTTTGVYEGTITAANGIGAAATQSFQITIMDPVDTPTLPLWGLAVLAFLLLAAGIRFHNPSERVTRS